MACFVGVVSILTQSSQFCFPLLHDCSPQFFKTIRKINVVFCLKSYTTHVVYAGDHHNYGFYSWWQNTALYVQACMRSLPQSVTYQSFLQTAKIDSIGGSKRDILPCGVTTNFEMDLLLLLFSQKKECSVFGLIKKIEFFFSVLLKISPLGDGKKNLNKAIYK